jgi:hypothetical protein
MQQLKLPFPLPDGYKLIFRPWTTKNGKRIYARQFGKRAFPMLVKVED